MSNTVVRTNVMALNSHRSLKNVGTSQSKASQRLSSGYKVNSAADDAAGLAISEKMRAQIRGLDQASTNAQDAISLIQTAEGGMQEIDNMVQRIRELVVKAANDTNDQDDVTDVNGDRQKIQDEIDSLLTEIDDMTTRVEFNQKKLIDGTWAGTAKPDSTITAGKEPVAGSTTYTTTSSITIGVTSLKIDTSGNAVVTGTLKDTTDTTISNGVTWSSLVGKKFSDGTYVYEVTAEGFDTYELGSAGTPTNLLASANDTVNGIVFTSQGSASGDKVTASVALYDSTGTVVTASTPLADGTYTDAAGNEYVTAFTDGVGSITPTLIDASSKTSTELITTTGATPASTDMIAAKGSYTATTAGGTTSSNGILTISATGVIGGTVTMDGGTTTTDLTDVDARAGKTFTTDDGSVFAFSADGSELTAAIKGSSSGNSLHFQIGANSGQSLLLNIGSVTTKTLSIDTLKTDGVMAKSGADLTAILSTMDDALSVVTTQRSKLGAAQNRLEYTIASLDVSSENLSSAESRIRDADMAKEMMNLTQANVLQQAATSMLAQANQAPQGVLQLLQ